MLDGLLASLPGDDADRLLPSLVLLRDELAPDAKPRVEEVLFDHPG